VRGFAAPIGRFVASRTPLDAVFGDNAQARVWFCMSRQRPPPPELSSQMPLSSLSARLIRGNEEVVRGHFTTPDIYLPGSHPGCGCGVRYGGGGANP
jgi:hypothetical protein